MAKKCANGECSIRKQYDGRREGRCTADHHPETGKRITKNLLGKTQVECNAKLAKAMERSLDKANCTTFVSKQASRDAKRRLILSRPKAGSSIREVPAPQDAVVLPKAGAPRQAPR